MQARYSAVGLQARNILFEPELVFNIFVIFYFSDFTDDNENGM